MNALRRLLHPAGVQHSLAAPLAATVGLHWQPPASAETRHKTAATMLLHRSWQRSFSLSSKLQAAAASYYDLLGISPAATQADVKSAYYKLSMIYHPDKSPGNAEAVEKFRAITAAYEVLSNYRLRRLYDKGIGGSSPSVGPRSAYGHHAPRPNADDEEAEPDDAQTRFYKRHMQRTEAPHASGRTPIYNYDAWTEAHYGQTFERRQAAKAKYEKKVSDIRLQREGFQSEVVVFGAIFAFLLMLFVSIRVNSGDEDRVAAGKAKTTATATATTTQKKVE